jgi:lipid II:glycine glycyltransferase (peptidoglycan interpeptide bridge formation enzyme)
MAKIVAVPEQELQAVTQRREALEKELSKELAIEEERKKITELEQKIKIEQKRIHPSKLQKLSVAVAGIGTTLRQLEDKKRQTLEQKVL